MLIFGTTSTTFHSSLSIGILALLVIFPIATLALLMISKDQVPSEKFQKRFGELVLALKLKERSNLLYPVLFMFRRYFYAYILI